MLPHFKYHPDPIATGSIEPSDTVCVSCGRARGYIYTGPVHATEELDGSLCPWCIADGSAAERFDAEFTDPAGIASGLWPAVPDAVVLEVSRRTPGFTGWQQERWWTHCGDAGEFLGRAGADDLAGRWSGALAAIRDDVLVDDEEWEEILPTLHPDGDATAYVFRCRTCGQLGGYADWA
ncbi:MAG: CbrC family protein [Longimicrobiaceae bacterium]